MNKVILNWQRSLWEGDQDLVKSLGRNEPMWIAIYKFMEATLGISESQTSKNNMSFLLSFMFFHQQNLRRGWNGF
jgi:hypothetical protein